MQATIPKSNIGYDQYTVPNDCSCWTYFCCFPLALANICLWPLVPFFKISLENRADLNHSQYLLGLLRALFLTTFLETALYDFLNQTMQTLTNSVTCVRSVWIDVSWVEDCWAFCIATHIILIPRIGCKKYWKNKLSATLLYGPLLYTNTAFSRRFF